MRKLSILLCMFFAVTIVYASGIRDKARAASESGPIQARYVAVERVAKPTPPARIDEVWEAIIRPSLNVDMQLDSQLLYDYGETMAVPLYAAFNMRNKSYIDDFTNNFKKLVALSHENFKPADIGYLYAFDYLWLASDYLALSVEYDESIIPENLDTLLYQFTVDAWNSPFSVWSASSFPNMAESLESKLEYRNTGNAYFNAYPDAEYFVMATAVNLYYFYVNSTNSHGTERAEYLLNNIVKYVPQILDTFFVLKDGWYQYQPGVWRDHRDFLYASYNSIAERKGPVQIADILEDTGHYSRIPKLLQTFRRILSTEYKNKIDEIQSTMSAHFVKNIATPPGVAGNTRNFYSVKTYMSGHNGLYRWNYGGRGENYASLPFSLYSTLYSARYAFMNTPEIRDLHLKLIPFFSIFEKQGASSAEAAKKPGTAVSSSYALINGFFEVNCLLSEYMFD